MSSPGRGNNNAESNREQLLTTPKLIGNTITNTTLNDTIDFTNQSKITELPSIYFKPGMVSDDYSTCDPDESKFFKASQVEKPEDNSFRPQREFFNESKQN